MLSALPVRRDIERVEQRRCNLALGKERLLRQREDGTNALLVQRHKVFGVQRNPARRSPIGFDSRDLHALPVCCSSQRVASSNHGAGTAIALGSNS